MNDDYKSPDPIRTETWMIKKAYEDYVRETNRKLENTHPLLKILNSLNNNFTSCNDECSGCYSVVAAISNIIDYIIQKEQSC